MGKQHQPTFIAASEVQKIKKGWGHELIFASNDDYCGKILHYDNKDTVSSFHSHQFKRESFKILRGSFELGYCDENGRICSKVLRIGDVVHIPPCVPHQLCALEDNSEVIEVSTEDDPEDVIRIAPGLSQAKIK